MEKHFLNINIDSPRAYCAPQVSVMTIETEGVLCQSNGLGIGSANEGYGNGGSTDF